jgi:hypothetical protein
MIKDLSRVALIDLLAANRASVEIVSFARRLAAVSLARDRWPEVR